MKGYTVYHRPDGQVMLALYDDPDRTEWICTLELSLNQARKMGSALLGLSVPPPPKPRRWRLPVLRRV